MRIILSITSLTHGKGGAERVASELANEMVARGHEIIMLCDAEPDAMPAYQLTESIQVIRERFRQDNYANIRTKICELKPDVFFMFHYGFNLVQQYALVHGTRIPIGVQECTNPPRAVRMMLKDPSVTTIDGAFRCRQSIFANMQGIRLTLPSYVNSIAAVSLPNARSFPNTFDLSGKQAEPGKTDGIKTIINVSGLKVANKNGIVLAKAFSQLTDEFPDWKLVFVGKYTDAIGKEIENATNGAPNIELVGKVDNVSSLYTSAQLHVICSFEEGLPNVVCEAMLHGVPSIGFSDCRGTNEIIKDGENGILIDRQPEVENLTNALRDLMSDPEKRAELGRNALEEAQQLFDPRNIYDQWEKLFFNIAAYSGNTHKLFKEQSEISPLEAKSEKLARELLISNFHANNSNDSEIVNVNRSPLFRIDAQSQAPKVSIIIPVFNKEDFVEETIESVLKDDYPNKEIILVDDCSTDQSANVLKKYADTNPIIKLVTREKNGGLSAARNSGLEHVDGEFVHFWDADDIYSSSSLSKAISVMIEAASDVAVGLAERNGEVADWYQQTNRHEPSTTYLASPYAFSTNSACFKIYRKDFLDYWKLRFVSGLHVEDMEFNFRVFARANLVSIVPEVLGEYRAVENSLSSQVNEQRILSTFEVDELTKNYVIENELHEYEALRQRHIMRMVFLFFVNRLVKGKHDLSNEFVNESIHKYRQIISGYRDGIVELQASDPFWGLAFIAFACRRNHLASTLFSRQAPPENCAILLARNPFGFSPYVIESYVRAVAK